MSLRFWAARQRRPTENFKYLWLGLRLGKNHAKKWNAPGKRFGLACGGVRHYIPPMSIRKLESKALISFPPAGMILANKF
jgi:hypothetical protein